MKLTPGKLYKLRHQLRIVGGNPGKAPWEDTILEKDQVYLCTSFKDYKKYRHVSIKFLVGRVEVAMSMNTETTNYWLEKVE